MSVRHSNWRMANDDPLQAGRKKKKGRRKVGRKKRRMRSKIRHRKS